MALPTEARAIIQALSRLDQNQSKSDAAKNRSDAEEFSRRLTLVLQGPQNAAVDLMFSDCGEGKKEGNGKGVSTEDLAKETGADGLLISRILRLLAGGGWVKEEAADLWSPTELTVCMADPAIAAGHRFVGDMLMTSAILAPKFLRETQHKCPTEPADGFVQYAHHTKLPIFPFLQTQPMHMQAFDRFMGNTMGERRYWYEWFDIQKEILEGYEDGTKLLVDVAGGKGHDIQAFHQKVTGMGVGIGERGSLVLQEQPPVLAAIESSALDPSIQKMEVDFFAEQPVKGARVYFLHHIVHDRSDPYCLRILANLRQAMREGYSKLVVHDLVLPDQGVSGYQARWDLTMMTFNSGMKRSESQWRGLLGEAGFRSVECYWGEDGGDADGVVVAMV